VLAAHDAAYAHALNAVFLATQSWGDVAAGSYFEVVTHYDFGYASARDFDVSY